MDSIPKIVQSSSTPPAMAAQWLGQLAPWLLPVKRLREALPTAVPGDFTLRKLIESKASSGTCFPIMVWTGTADSFDCGDRLRPAFVLPFQWRKGDSHSSKLPEGVRRVADEVRSAMEEKGFGLHLGIDHAEHFGDFDIDFRSAWAALAAALLLAKDGRASDPSVLATADFDIAHGPKGVGFMEAKVALAIEAGCDRLFVATEDERKARIAADGQLQIEGLPLHPEPGIALAAYLARLEVRPPRVASLDQKLAYHQRLRKQRPKEAADYYREELLDSLLGRCKERSRDPSLAELRGRTLVTFLSLGPTGVLFAARCLEPGHTIVLHTHKSLDEPGAEAVIKRLESLSGPVRFIESEMSGPGLARALDKIGTTEGLVADLTPGTKEWTVACLTALPPDARFVYLRTEWKDGELLTGTEKLVSVEPGHAQR